MFLYLIIALPLGYVMLGFLLGAQGGNLLDRRDLVRSRTPIYVYASLFKIGVVLIALAFIAFPALAGHPARRHCRSRRADALHRGRAAAGGYVVLWVGTGREVAYA